MPRKVLTTRWRTTHYNVCPFSKPRLNITIQFQWSFPWIHRVSIESSHVDHWLAHNCVCQRVMRWGMRACRGCGKFCCRHIAGSSLLSLLYWIIPDDPLSRYCSVVLQRVLRVRHKKGKKTTNLPSQWLENNYHLRYPYPINNPRKSVSPVVKFYTLTAVTINTERKLVYKILHSDRDFSILHTQQVVGWPMNPEKRADWQSSKNNKVQRVTWSGNN